MTLTRLFRNACCILLVSWASVFRIANAGELTIRQDPGSIGEAISFLASGELDLDPSDSVAEFVVDFSPEYLSNPLGGIPAFSSFRTVSWGSVQDVSGITVTEYVSDGADQIVPIADFEPVTLTATGYTAGDVPFPAQFPFELRQFGVRIEGLQGGPLVSFTKDAQTNGRGGGRVALSPSDYEPVKYDDLRDELEVFSYELAGGGTLDMDDRGLNFIASSPGGVRVMTSDGEELPTSDSWSIRAHFTIDRIVGLGLAGVGVTSPDRWAAVLGASHDQEYGVGQGLSPQKIRILNGDITDDPFVVQLDFSEDGLIGHFWRPENPTDVTTIEYAQGYDDRAGPVRLANNGTDVTYHELWISNDPIPLPTGFESLGDFNGNGILDASDLQFVADNIQSDSRLTDLNDDGAVNFGDIGVWVKDYYRSWIGDSDLNGIFDSSDLVQVFTASEYEDDVASNSTWATGDWNGDGDFDSADIVFAFKDGGYEQLSDQDLATVPEPSCVALLAIGIVGIFRRVVRQKMDA